MSGYIWMLLWLLIYTALSAVLEVQQSETVCGVQTVRFTKLWAALGVLPLLIFCTLRGDIGDTYNYMHAFSEMPSTLHPVFTERSRLFPAFRTHQAFVRRAGARLVLHSRRASALAAR